MHQFNPSIFREYDIRGVYNETLTDACAYQIGLNYGTKLGQGKIAVGYDGRLSSPTLSSSLIRGLNDAGINVVNIGLVPTPATYFAVFQLGLDGGIMVTGSHNPPSHNGFKIMLGKDSMHGAGIAELKQIAGKKAGVAGTVEKRDVRTDYIKKIIGQNQLFNFKIGYDSGNGASGEIIDMLAPKLSAKYSLLNTKIDGTFPVHHPDPTVEKNLEQLKQEVLDNQLDVGFAFDGDGDRVGVVDNKGRPIWGDQILAILCRGIADRYQGASIVVDVKTSKAAVDYIASLGLKPVMWKTGHSLIKAKMKELKSPLSGEMSAHIFFADDYFGFDDGILAAIRFLEVMKKTGKTSAELLDDLPKMFSSPEYKITVDEAKKFQLVEQIKAAAKANCSSAKLIDIDGMRVENPDSWWLARASNTGNHIICRFEASSAEAYKAIEQQLRQILAIAGLKLV
jgi:phosphomannomutase